MRFPSRSLVAPLLLLALTAAPAATQSTETNPRFGRWQLQSDQPPPYRNVMTYEPYGDGGMRVTIEATSAEGETRRWGYVTFFDGVYRPVTGDSSTEESAVEVIDERTNKIYNRTGERVNVIINVLSEDGNRIDNEYRSVDADGNERTSHATYLRIR